ncbi:MAG TPA: VCBS repeat-containing protein, partial [Pyrinomonadaceae bacterium]|nr:VCBS repeat-containing protein [Pyrinomonadaceae bacterium]
LGEPNHAGNVGGKSIWFKWMSQAAVPTSMTFELRSMSTSSSPIGVFSLLAVYTGSTLDSLATVRSSARQGLNKVVFTATPGTTYYIAIDGYDSGGGAATGTFDLSYRPTKSPRQADFDRDGKADLAVYRPTTGVWYSFETSTEEMRGHQFGANGDKPLIGNDGVNDGMIDHTVYRPDTGVWYISKSTGGFSIFAFGVATDVPMVRYSENQLSQTATVFRPQDGTWWTRAQNGTYSVVQWGALGDIPLLADFTGDGTDETTVFRPSTGTWYILKSGSYSVIQFGQDGDKPVPADYDGDGRTDPAIFRPATNTWWILRSTDNAQIATQFGAATDKLQPADYDGDGKDDIAVFRNGVWWVLQSSDGAVKAAQFGLGTDIPIASPMQ